MAVHIALVVIDNKVSFLPDGDFLEGALPYGAQTFTGDFVGEAVVTGTGEDFQIHVGGPAGSSWRLKLAKVTRAEKLGTTGTTTLKVADAPVGGTPTKSMTFGVAINQTSGSTISPLDFVIPVDSTLYVSVQSTGLHGNVHFQLQLEQVQE